MMSNEKRSDHYVSARTIYVVIPLYSSIPCALPRVCRSLYIPQFPARYREYVGEIYELEYYYHHPILFLSSFFLFLLSFLFFALLYTNYHRWGLFVILSKYIHMRSCFEGFIKLSYNIF
jgi:hypothetical protein